MSTIKLAYPSTSSSAVTISLASLASSTTFVAGRASTAVDNTSNLDVDALLSGHIRAGTSPTVSTFINVYLYACNSTSSGTPSYPVGITGSDAALTISSINLMNAGIRLAASIMIDNTSDRDYYFGPISVASFFGGALPKFWGVYVGHSTAVNLNSTAGNHAITFERVQFQAV